MLVSEKDIIIILESNENLTKDEFIIRNEDGFYQLRNVDSHCYFYDPKVKECKIYSSRPRGCRFYPLVYDLERQKCIFDDDCPRPEIFYPTAQAIKNKCKDLKLFLKREIGINNMIQSDD